MEKHLEGTVRLEIIGGQGEIKNCCDGQCFFRNGHHYVMFQEDLPEDGGRSVTSFSSRLKISDDQVTLKRTLLGGSEGKSAPAMEFVYQKKEPGEPGCFVNYPTPYGTMCLEIRTEELSIKKTEGEMRLTVRYLMLQEKREMLRDELLITLREKK